MLNYLRSDFFRLHKGGVLVGALLAPTLIALITTVMTWAMSLGILGFEQAPDASMGESWLHLASAGGFDAAMLIIVAAWPVMWLVSSDFKNHTFKTVLGTASARRSYVLAKVAVAAFFSAVLPVVMMASFALLPALFGQTYAEPTSLVDAVRWWAPAAAVCFGYAILAQVLLFVTKNETIGWIGLFFFTAGGLENLLMLGIGVVVFSLSLPASVLETAIGLLMFSQAQAAALGAGLVTGPAWLLARTIIASLTWGIIGAGACWLAFRRRSL